MNCKKQQKVYNKLYQEVMKYLRTYGVSFLISIASLLLVALFMPVTNHTPQFVFCLLAVAISAWDRRLNAAITTIVITTLGIDYLFLPPVYSFNLSQFSEIMQLIVYIFTAIMITLVIEKTRNPRNIASYKKKEKEYLELMTKMQKENARFQKEIKARDEFLSIASHELKTPLSSMLLQIQTALHNIRNVSLANFSVENLLKMLQSTEQQSKRLSKMINDLLNVSLITTGRLELEIEEVDLSELVKEIVDHFSERAKRDGYQLNLTTNGKLIGSFDKLRIEQALSNLISNALKYGNGKPIEITVHKRNSTALLSVADHGIGIPSEAQDRIFERFERIVSNHEIKGLGVGLYITYQIVKAHNGTIKVNSQLNEGSEFTIELPVKKQEEKTDRNA